MLRAGQLNQRVIVQQVTETIGASGKITRAWAILSTRWASVRPRNVESQPSDGNIVNVVRMRYYRILTPTIHRILCPRQTTTLAAGINASVTTITTTDALGFAGNDVNPVAPFRLRIGSELLMVTAGHGTTTLTVTRGVEGSTAATHAAGDAVEQMAVLNIGAALVVDSVTEETQIMATEETNKPVGI